MHGLRSGTVSTGTRALPTVGGALVDIVGVNLGLASSAIVVAYSGGSLGLTPRSHTLTAGVCTVVTPGTAIQVR